MEITFKQTFIKGVFDEEYLEEHIESIIVPNIGDYVRVGRIYGKVIDKYIDYCNNIEIRVKPREMF